MKKLIIYCVLVFTVIFVILFYNINHLPDHNAYKVNDIDKSNFLDLTDRTVLTNFYVKGRTFRLPAGTTQYMVLDNHILNNTIILKKFDRLTNHRSIEKFAISDNLRKVDSINISTMAENAKQFYLSPDASKIVISTDQNEIKIFDIKNKKQIYSQRFSSKVRLYQSPWSENNNSIVLSVKGNIYIINLLNNEIRGYRTKSEYVMWMQKQNKILFLENEKTVKTLDPDTGVIQYVYRINSSLISKAELLDYYWFKQEGKILLKLRYTNKILSEIWSDKEVILKY